MVQGGISAIMLIDFLYIINHCSKYDIEGMLVSIDFQKAFDTMEWDFVCRAMLYFRLPDHFVNWIKICYTNIESCVVNDGHISDFFKPGGGVCQGCPLSPYIFILGAES